MAIFHSRKKLLNAIREGDEALVREHLANAERRSEWLGALTDDGFHAVHIAVEHRQMALIPLLLEYGAEIDARTRRGITPLMLAPTRRPQITTDFLFLAMPSITSAPTSPV